MNNSPTPRLGIWPLVLAAIVLGPSSSGAQPAPPPTTPPPATQPASAAGDPFARLRVVTPKAQLKPLRSVRVRDKRERAKGKIKILVRSSPSGAAVTHGGKALGKTPLTITAERNSTPMDIVLRMRRYMTLRTRIMRRVSRSYFFRLSPAKVH